MCIEVIVVDNDSRDDSVRYVRKHFPRVHVITNRRNRGFAAANNQGLIAATGRNVLFLNSDTVVQTEALRSMVDFLDDTPDAAVCSCRLVDGDGRLQPCVRTFPSFRAMLHRHTALKYTGLFKAARASYKMHGFPYDKTSAVDQVSGAVLMAKRNVLERLGGMDENLSFYFEETDLCRRVRQAGGQVYFIPSGEITHFGGASTTRMGQYRAQALYFRSLFYYFRKHRGRGQTWLFSCVFKPGLCLYVLCELVLGAARALLSWLLGQGRDRIVQHIRYSQNCFLFLARYGLRVLLY
jgi:GT2 family glycosyltransferase